MASPLLALCLLLFLPATATAQIRIGFAKVDVTPDEPIRLSGYGSRRAPHDGVATRLWVKAMAIASQEDVPPAILITVDNCGVPWHVRHAVAQELTRRVRIPQERVTVGSTHTHAAPMLRGVLENLFAQPIASDEQVVIDRYTKRLRDAMVQTALDALRNLTPARLRAARGTLTFAANRRRLDAGLYRGFGVEVRGPVDHDLPVLFAEDEPGNVLGIVTSYACHCTTLGGDFNAVCGDWAGFAGKALEERFDGATALVLIGCAGDQNPAPRGTLALAERHGSSLADAVVTLHEHAEPLAAVAPTCTLRTIDLPFQETPSRSFFEERARQPGIVGHHARRQLERLDHGEELARTLPYPVQVWSFADELAMVFLGGEVVVDYSIALRTALDRTRTWVSAYCNDVPCYIPSRRILREGGYEADDSLLYYDRPTRFAPAVEDRILDTVLELVPPAFHVPNGRTARVGPTAPEDALDTFTIDDRFRIELVASEPLIDDPIAIDWDLEGNLWVLEMRDYPQGLEGGYEPGGRVVKLSDEDGDGRYETRRMFLEDLPFPTGLHVWNDGVLVCAAPDILWARDVDGDGRADARDTVFTGFDTSNYQARVNGFQLGLDHWLHGSSGLFGGEVSRPGEGEPFTLRGRDFRIQATPWRLEPVTGLSQHGRVRDDWDAWFGNDNGHLLWHYPMRTEDLERNPYVASPAARILVPRDADPFQMFPRGPRLERYNHPEAWNRVTAACAPAIYRDHLLGDDLDGNAFVCEPAHDLVARRVLDRSGVVVTGLRAEDERDREFLTSRDPWCRPVQVRTGPDGSLWVVDLYRFLLEHPRWVPPQRLAEVDERAGSGMGRIYRIVPTNGAPRTRPRVAPTGIELATALDDPNGTWRDMVHARLLREGRAEDRPVVIDVACTSAWPAARLQAWCVVDALAPLTPAELGHALRDADPRVRRGVLRLARTHLDRHPERGRVILAHREGNDALERHELALALGSLPDAEAGMRLANLYRRQPDDAWMRAAILSSARHHWATLLETAAALEGAPDETIDALVATGLGFDGQTATPRALRAFLAAVPSEPTFAETTRLANHLSILVRRGANIREALQTMRSNHDPALPRIEGVRRAARTIVEAQTDDVTRLGPALRVLAALTEDAERDRALWSTFLEPHRPASLRDVAVDVLLQAHVSSVDDALIERFARFTPRLRARVIDGFLEHREGVAALWRALEERRIDPRSFDAAQRQRLSNHVGPETRERLATVFETNTETRTRERRFDPRELETLSGDLDAGRQVFAQRCAICHRFRGQGKEVGPDLAALTDRRATYLLSEIEDPSARVLAPYVTYLIETQDGEFVTGMIVEEGETSLRIALSDGKERTVLRREILTTHSLGASLMPEDLVADLTNQRMKDLLTYLSSAPTPFGIVDETEERSARQAFLARSPNGCTRIVSSAESLPYASWIGRLPLHVCRQTDGTSRLIWEGEPFANAPRDDGRVVYRLAAAMGFRSQPDGEFTLQVGASHVTFSMVLDDATFASEDGRITLSYFVRQRNTQDGCGELTILLDESLLEPDSPVRFEVRGSASESQRWFGVYTLPAH